MKINYLSFFLSLNLLFCLTAYAQERVIVTGAPFLRIAPDARSGGMGDMGVATSADAFSQYWNPSKSLFSEQYSSIGLGFTPVLSNITDDVFLLNASYRTYTSSERRSVFGASVYYFSLGEIQLNELIPGGTGSSQIQSNGIAKPNEFALDLSYGLKLSDNYGMAVALRYIRSDIFNNDDDANTEAANTFAVDVSGYFQTKEHKLGNIEGRARAGFNVKNIGPKLDYSTSDDNSNFLPTNLGVGGGYDFILDDDHKIGVTTELNKLLVPTPQEEVDLDGDGIPDSVIPNDGVVEGVFNSFSDAPDGFSEELKEITYAIGAEYSYQDAFKGRLGYFHESEDKGSRQFATLGLGVRLTSLDIDASYLIPTTEINNAQEGTLRFSLTWNFGGEKEVK